MDNDPLREIRIAYDNAEHALQQAMNSQEQNGPDLQADGLVGSLSDLLDVISNELPELDRLLNHRHD